MDNKDNEKFELLTKRLSDAEKGKVFAFCQDEAMVKAVEKVLTYSIYQMGTVSVDDKEVYDVNWAFGLANLPTEQIGLELKARVTGLSYLDDGIKQLKKFGVKPVENTEKTNKAR